MSLEKGVFGVLERIIPLTSDNADELALFMLSFFELGYKRTDYTPVRKPPQYVKMVHAHRNRKRR